MGYVFLKWKNPKAKKWLTGITKKMKLLNIGKLK